MDHGQEEKMESMHVSDENNICQSIANSWNIFLIKDSGDFQEDDCCFFMWLTFLTAMKQTFVKI